MQSRKRSFKDRQLASKVSWIFPPAGRGSVPAGLKPAGWRSAGSAAWPRDRVISGSCPDDR